MQSATASGIPTVFVTQNDTGEAGGLCKKLNKLRTQHERALAAAGFTGDGLPLLDYTVVGKLTVEGVAEAFHRNKVLVCINNASQLGRVHAGWVRAGNPVFTALCDEADATDGGKMQDASVCDGNSAIVQLRAIKQAARTCVDVTATPNDVLRANSFLLCGDVLFLEPRETYRGIRDIKHIKPVDEETIGKWKDKDGGVAANTSLKAVLDGIPADGYNGHPAVMLATVANEKAAHRAVGEFVAGLGGWDVIVENGDGLYHKGVVCLAQTSNVPVTPDGWEEFKITRKELMELLYKNGSKRILISTGRFADRSRSYVSADGRISLTHHFSANDPDVQSKAVQKMRLCHDLPDKIGGAYVPMHLITSRTPGKR